MTYEGKIFEEGGYVNYYSNIAFFETNVILNSGVIFEVNSKIALTKNS